MANGNRTVKVQSGKGDVLSMSIKQDLRRYLDLSPGDILYQTRVPQGARISHGDYQHECTSPGILVTGSPYVGKPNMGVSGLVAISWGNIKQPVEVTIFPDGTSKYKEIGSPC